jgi:hypothetical protein
MMKPFFTSLAFACLTSLVSGQDVAVSLLINGRQPVTNASCSGDELSAIHH